VKYYDDLVELARICLKQASEAPNKTVADELTCLATEYATRAAERAEMLGISSGGASSGPCKPQSSSSPLVSS
jgi:hypothetical protein